MITLTTPRPLGSVTKWRVIRVVPDDDNSYAVLTVQVITNANFLLAERQLEIHNGLSDHLEWATPPVGGSLGDAVVHTAGGTLTPTGYDDAVAAWRMGANPAARRSALESWLLAANIVGETLAGS